VTWEGDPAVQAILRAACALLFATAALHKLRDPRGFREALGGYRLLPSTWLAPTAIALPVTELGTALALATTGLAGAGAAAGAGLLVLYAGAIGINLLRGRSSIDCGCGGPGGRRPIGTALVWRNAGLVAALLLAARPSSPRLWTWLDSVTLVAGVTTLALLYAALDVLLANHGRVGAARLPDAEAREAGWATH
jgi:hypothetical protein